MKILAVMLGALLSISAATASDRPGDGEWHPVGVKYRDARKIAFLKSILDSLALEYSEQVEADGTLVFWQARSQQEAEAILLRVAQLPGARTGVSYDDPQSREYLKRVLEAMGLDYEIEAREDGTWITWYSTDDAQADEVSNRVSQYFFIRDVCRELPLPTPDQPANAEIACAE